jgi:putative colanic acid biosysnthesis UDP-glucose lipid carrier transferase
LKRYTKVLVPLFAISEMLTIALSAYIAVYLRHGIESMPSSVHEAILFISVALWPLLSGATGYYKDRRTRTFFRTFAHLTLQWFVITSILFAYLVLAKSDISRLSFSLFLIFGYISLIVTGQIRHYFLVRIRTRGMNQRAVIFIGQEHQHSSYITWLHENPSFGYYLIGFVNTEETNDVLCPVSKLEQVLVAYKADEILLGNFESRGEILTDIVDVGEESGCRIRIIQEKEDVYSRHLDVHQFGPFKVFSVREEPLSQTPAKIFKRIFDVVFSTLVLLFIYWWIYAIVCLLVKLSSKGPIFFKQKRVGRGGQEFYCIKFRTMSGNGGDIEGNSEITKLNDNRITSLGAFLRKTNIDELPQFLNVLLGDMSVVGPRPHMLEEDYTVAEKLRKYRIRRFIRPGISGWAQVNGYRGGTEDMELMQKRVDYDIEYIEIWTPWLDIKIIYYTILQMLTLKTGAH